MMKRSINLILLLAIVCATSAMAQEPELSTWQKVKNFAQKHKSKIIAGITIAAALGASVGLIYHADKTMSAIEKAGIQPGDPEFTTAVGLVGLFGPLGAINTLDILVKAVDRKIITSEQAFSIVFSKTGDALAYYFGIAPTSFRLHASTKGIKEVAKAAWHEVQQATGKLKNFVSNLVR